MNYKLLFPTYRTRERWIHDVLGSLPPIGRMLNVGSGEGDIDPSLATHATELLACDINEGDIAQARLANAGVANLHYSVQDSEALRFESASFDVVLSLEVIEHVMNPRLMLSELARVLKPGGTIILTCPNVHFPFTYDPLNATLAAFVGDAHVPIGAYAYGHTWLVDEAALEGWFAGADLRVARKTKLSGWFVGALECYWPGLLQRALKANARNASGASAGRAKVRPSSKTPSLVGVVDALIKADRTLSAGHSRSIGLGYVAHRR